MARNSEQNPDSDSPPKTPRKTAKKTSKEGVTAKKATGKASKKAPIKPAKKTIRKAASRAVSPEKNPSNKEVLSGEASVDDSEFRLPSRDPEVRKLLEDLIAFLEEKKIEDLRVMNLEEVNPYFCFFVIVTATSPLQLQSIAREISKRFGVHLSNKRLRPVDVESGWVIQDFVDIVLHIFLREEREYYNLEKLWGDAPTIYSSEEPRFRWSRGDTKAGR